MTDDLEIKIGIAKMYYHMGRSCKNISKVIEKDPSTYEYLERKMGFEFKTRDKKYQLILELKEVEDE